MLCTEITTQMSENVNALLYLVYDKLFLLVVLDRNPASKPRPAGSIITKIRVPNCISKSFES